VKMAVGVAISRTRRNFGRRVSSQSAYGRARRYRTLVTVGELEAAVAKIAEQTAILTSTVQRPKGREWPDVFVIGVTDDVLPDYRADTPPKVLDERNVLFVASTQASARPDSRALAAVHGESELPVHDSERAKPISLPIHHAELFDPFVSLRTSSARTLCSATQTDSPCISRYDIKSDFSRLVVDA
jgi:hypothetical protein